MTEYSGILFGCFIIGVVIIFISTLGDAYKNKLFEEANMVCAEKGSFRAIDYKYDFGILTHVQCLDNTKYIMYYIKDCEGEEEFDKWGERTNYRLCKNVPRWALI
jgi:hypothetical protein